MEFHFTKVGFWWVAVGLLLFLISFRKEVVLVKFLVFASIFQSMSVFELSFMGRNIPIIPFYWAEALLLTRWGFGLIYDHIVYVQKRSLQVLWLFTLFGGYAAVSVLVFPRLWFGLPVYDPRGGISRQFDRLSELSFSVSMIGQVGYTWMNILLLWFIAMWSNKEHTLGKDFQKWISLSGMVVVLIAYWQFLARAGGFYFPDDILYNIQGWKINALQKLMRDLYRVNATFTEPSNLAAYLLGLLGYGLELVRGGGGKKPALFLSLVVGALILSGSSTAYIGGGGLLVSFVFLQLRTILRMKGMMGRIMVVIAVLVIVTILVTPFYPWTDVMVDQTLGKIESFSLMTRLAADRRALEIVLETWGLGVGLGGNRPSSFLTFLISNVGIIGTILFVAALLLLVRAVLEQQDKPMCERLVRRAAVWGLTGSLIGKVISQPDIMFPPLWVWVFFLMSMLNDKQSFSQTHTKRILGMVQRL